MVQPAHDAHFPDLQTGSIPLEVNATTKPLKGGEAHNGHAGGTVVAAFELDKATGTIDFHALERRNRGVRLARRARWTERAKVALENPTYSAF